MNESGALHDYESRLRSSALLSLLLVVFLLVLVLPGGIALGNILLVFLLLLGFMSGLLARLGAGLLGCFLVWIVCHEDSPEATRI